MSQGAVSGHSGVIAGVGQVLYYLSYTVSPFLFVCFVLFLR
jgi:hypothetical protein